MKWKMIALGCVLAVSVMGFSFMGSAEAEEASFIKVPVGVNYASTYWWRGVELNGKGVGVIWPSVGLALGDTGVAFSVASGINSDAFMINEEGDKKSAKKLHEMDYGASYSTTLGDLVSLGVGAMFIKYYYHDASDRHASDPSFMEGSLSVGLNTILNPKLDAYYDYYVDENSNAPENPKDEDYYLKFSLTQDLITVDKCKFTAGAWVGYYNDPYFDAIGFSDAGVKLGTSMELKGVTFASSFNYARSLSNDFQLDYDQDGDGVSSKLRNHFWLEFGASYTL